MIDVVVEHPVYGQLTAPLQIASRYDVEQYLLRMENLGGQPLSMLTDGIHLHTLSCPRRGGVFPAARAAAGAGHARGLNCPLTNEKRSV